MLTVDIHKLDIYPGVKVLDAGCGTGRHICRVFQEDGVDVVGIDTNWQELLKTRYTLYMMDNQQSGSWIVSRSDVTALPFQNEVFDIVICSEVLEHIPDNAAAASELVRVLKPGGDLIVSVPRFLPERICWALSDSYHNEPGGHIRIYKKKEILNLLEGVGVKCREITYRHALHAPYWWLKCLVGHKREDSKPVNLFKRFLEWDIMKHPPLTRFLDEVMNPFIAKSIVFYLKKEKSIWN